MKNIIIMLLSVFTLASCGTIVNDPNVPVSLSFSDGSDGKCKLNNKRASYNVSLLAVGASCPMLCNSCQK